MVTRLPSNRISPLSGECVPAMHLISVDLPAPLSPTSAITSPFRTSKSTSVKACTDPNDFVMLRSWRSGVSVLFTVAVSYHKTSGGARSGRLHLVTSSADRLAVLLELADADVALLDELVLVELAHVGLGDPGDRKRHRRHPLLAVEPRSGRGRLLALHQRDRGRGRGTRLQGHGLVDRSGLPAGDDVLRAFDSGVLPTERDRLQVLRL